MRKPKENRNCPYCLASIGAVEEKVRCARCGVVHHAECWTTNGKCSVYGCDGWALWKEDIVKRLVPETGETLEVSPDDVESPKRREVVLCIECGAKVKPGRILCFDCGRKRKRHYLENCFGPSVLLLGGFVGLVAVIVRAFR